MKILIVDDTPANLEILGHILQRSGLEVSIAPTGEKALELVNLNKPDLILLDVRMPDIDGYEVCRRLKADVNTKDIFPLFLSPLWQAPKTWCGVIMWAALIISSNPFTKRKSFAG